MSRDLAETMPGGNAAAQSERVADGQYPVAHPDGVGIAESYFVEFKRRFDFDQGDVGFFVAADDVGFDFGVVKQYHVDDFGVLNHMIVGDDVSVFADDKARSQRYPAFQRIIIFPAAVAAFGRNVDLVGLLDGGDVDHRRDQLFRQIGKRRKTVLRPDGKSGGRAAQNHKPKS